MISIYFAGPDVFLPNYSEICERIRNICRRAAITPLLPGDAVLNSSEEIFKHNLNLIRGADGLVANLNPFRSPLEPDSGTVYECAYAWALGKPVFALLRDPGDMKMKLAAAGIRLDENGLCPGGWLVEDFGLPLNLMLAHSLTAVCRGLEEAVETAARFFAGKE